MLSRSSPGRYIAVIHAAPGQVLAGRITGFVSNPLPRDEAQAVLDREVASAQAAGRPLAVSVVLELPEPPS